MRHTRRGLSMMRNSNPENLTIGRGPHVLHADNRGSRVARGMTMPLILLASIISGGAP